MEDYKTQQQKAQIAVQKARDFEAALKDAYEAGLNISLFAHHEESATNIMGNLSISKEFCVNEFGE